MTISTLASLYDKPVSCGVARPSFASLAHPASTSASALTQLRAPRTVNLGLIRLTGRRGAGSGPAYHPGATGKTHMRGVRAPVEQPSPVVSTQGPARRHQVMADARQAWDQQAGENDLWYCRFMRFVALGPGRSVSLVATGRRNAYPVPAHWPIQAKQNHWRERARAFDEAVATGLKARDTVEDRVELVEAFNASLTILQANAPNGEAPALGAAIAAGGYQLPVSEDDEDYMPLAHG